MRVDVEAILAADEARRAERIKRENAELGIVEVPEGVDPYHYSRSIRGVPLSMTRKRQGRVIKASPSSWNRGMRYRTVGFAPGTDPQEGQTVAVTYSDGTTEIKSASSFRRQNIATRNTTHKRRRASEVDKQNALDAIKHRNAYELNLPTIHDPNE
jgi:hypothetical protein